MYTKICCLERNPGISSGALLGNAASQMILMSEELGLHGKAQPATTSRRSDSEALDPECEEVLGRPDTVYFTYIFLFKNLQVL